MIRGTILCLHDVKMLRNELDMDAKNFDSELEKIVLLKFNAERKFCISVFKSCLTHRGNIN